ncbi:MAG: hypothetical protein Q7R45_14040 [Sulfuricaulis sp.]|nr:hypothetical protein [Sulfuricaulis sp.]
MQTGVTIGNARQARETGLRYPSVMYFDLFYELTVPDFTIRNECQVFSGNI